MDNQDLSLEKVIYFDVSFISSIYEELKNEPIPSQITKTEGKKADVSIKILSGGIHAQETRNYTISSTSMLKKIYKDLYEYPKFEPEKYKKGSIVAWVEGNLTVSSWGDEKNREDEYEFFEFQKDGILFALITRDEYFSPGFESIMVLPLVLKCNIDFKARALLKILYYASPPKTYISSPLLIIEEDNN